MHRIWKELAGHRRLLREVVASAVQLSGHPKDTSTPQTILPVQVGSQQLRLTVRQFGHGGLRYINLHENEQTAVSAARATLKQQPGTLIELHGTGRRLVSFRAGLRPLAFDPNRIFTDVGAMATLRQFGSFTAAGMEAARRLRHAVLGLIDCPGDEPVVALHNNAGALYTIDAYRPGGRHAKDVEDVAIHEHRSRNAFFLVTRKAIFEALRDEGFNIVLQNDHPEDDGSLAVWCQQQRRSYVNVEAGFGALKEQELMLQALAAVPHP